MRSSDIRGGRALGLVLSLALLTSCGPDVVRQASPPGPGVPRIANLRFEPNVVRIGETTLMSFYFDVGSADVQEAFLVERGIQQFRFFQDLQATTIDLRNYDGQVAATVEVPLRWSTEGIRFLELYVVTKRGNVSNHLTASVTVR